MDKTTKAILEAEIVIRQADFATALLIWKVIGYCLLASLSLMILPLLYVLCT